MRDHVRAGGMDAATSYDRAQVAGQSEGGMRAPVPQSPLSVELPERLERLYHRLIDISNEVGGLNYRMFGPSLVPGPANSSLGSKEIGEDFASRVRHQLDLVEHLIGELAMTAGSLSVRV